MWRLYVLGAAALVVVGMGATIYKYRGDAIAAEARAARLAIERDTAIAVNAAMDKEIDRLTRQAEVTNNVLADLRHEIQAINAGVSVANQRLTDLEASNEDVKSFLDTALPAELERLLNGQ